MKDRETFWKWANILRRTSKITLWARVEVAQLSRKVIAEFSRKTPTKAMTTRSSRGPLRCTAAASIARPTT
jgi:hypothetical protein